MLPVVTSSNKVARRALHTRLVVVPLEDGLPAGSRPAEPRGGLPAFFYLDYDGISHPHVVQTREPAAPSAAASRSLPWAAVTHFVSPLRNPGLFPFFFPF